VSRFWAVPVNFSQESRQGCGGRFIGESAGDKGEAGPEIVLPDSAGVLAKECVDGWPAALGCPEVNQIDVLVGDWAGGPLREPWIINTVRGRDGADGPPGPAKRYQVTKCRASRRAGQLLNGRIELVVRGKCPRIVRA
jgi:hypothetical protein